MFIPVRSDRPLRTTPYVNYALIVLNALIFVLTTKHLSSDQYTQVHDFMLWKQGTSIWQFITYQFLHASPMHLIGNMIFLWVFGNAVEDRLGKFGYAFFYLAMGVFAGLGHWLTSDAPVLGASGSVAGVTGAFLALFPRTRITFIYFWFIIGTFEIPAMLVVLFYFMKDLFFLGMNVGNVAYTAHLAGNVGGFVVAMLLLWPRLLPREPYDLFSLWTHKRRRNKFRKLANEGYQAWEGKAHRPGKKGPAGEMTEKDKQVMEQRQAISRAINSHDLQEASRLYNAMVDQHGEQALSQRHQFEVANHLAGQDEHALAARAYAILLNTYPQHTERAHVQLMLGLINARYLNRPDQARPLLQEASQRLHGDDAALARQLLSELTA